MASKQSKVAAFLNRPRPIINLVDRHDEELSCAAKPVDMVYVRNCTGCKVYIRGTAAKCILESCKNITVELEDGLVTGTVEMVRCEGVTIDINPQDRLPTVSADQSDNITVKYHLPQAIGNIYTVKCSNVQVHLDPPCEQVLPLDLPSKEEIWQFVSEYIEGKMVTNMVVREGAGYPTTAEKKEVADKKQEMLEKRLESYIMSTIVPHLGGLVVPPREVEGQKEEAASKTSTNPAPTGTSKEDSPPTKDHSNEEPPTEQGPSKVPTNKGKSPSAAGPSKGKSPPAAGPSKGKSPPAAGPSKGKSPPPAGSSKGKSSVPHPDELGAAKGKLKPTETVVTHHTVVGNTTKPKDPNKPKPTYTSITDEEEKKEFFDTPEQADMKVKQIAQYMRDSRYTVMFTGAGISTSTGIPDFRSGMGTVLDTGPGVWELRAAALTPQEKAKLQKEKKQKRVDLVKALPSPTHMALVKLHEVGQVQLTVSQNVDGLHRRSNMNPKQLAELHGNTNLERCKKCGREYMRDFRTRVAHHVFSHETSRKCDNPKCRGQLLDSIVNFGENLPEHELTKAFKGADKADLIIVLGSSLRVTPAADVPRDVKKRGGKLVICNLQRTPLHGIADVNVHMMTDEFMKRLTAELGVEIPPFKLHRRMRITTKKDKDGKFGVAVEGVDPHIDAPYSFIAGIVASTEPRGKFAEIEKEPFSFKAPVGSSSIKLQVYFQGHYNEPRLDLDLPRREGRVLYNLNYQPGTASWQYELTPEQ